ASTLSRRARRAWMAAGGVSLALLAAMMTLDRARNPYGTLPISRTRAEALARAELQKRGVSPGPTWRVMPVADDGGDGPNQFVYETAGARRWHALLGAYLPRVRWLV